MNKNTKAWLGFIVGMLIGAAIVFGIMWSRGWFQ